MVVYFDFVQKELRVVVQTHLVLSVSAAVKTQQVVKLAKQLLAFVLNKLVVMSRSHDFRQLVLRVLQKIQHLHMCLQVVQNLLLLGE